MMLLRPGRDRGELIQKIRPVRPWAPPPPENEVLRGTQQPRRVQPAKPARSTWRWKPDTWAERADAWLWEHPVIHTIAVSLIVGGLMWALIWCTLKVARMQP